MAVTGSQRFAVLLCKVSDDPGEPQPPSFVLDLFAHRGTGGLNDYWVDVSGGVINLDGTDVFGWTPLDQTRDDFIADRPTRGNKIDGAKAAFPEVDLTPYTGVIAVFNTQMGDAGASGRGILAGPGELSVSYMAHETGHIFGLQHSFDRSNRQAQTWSQKGEYFDPYDIMSAMRAHSGEHDQFGATGPLVCAGNLDLMGWLPSHRVWRPPISGGSSSEEIELISLGHRDTPGYLAAVIGNLYVELRTQDGWDSGLPRAGVLIHRMSGGNAVILARTLPGEVFGDRGPYRQDWQPGQTFAPDDLTLSLQGGTSVEVLSIDEEVGKARVRVGVRVPPRQEVGPGVILGGVTRDGGGWVVLPSGKVVKVPPHSPVLRAVEALAVAAQVEGLVHEELQQQLNTITAKELERVALQLRG